MFFEQFVGLFKGPFDHLFLNVFAYLDVVKLYVWFRSNHKER